MFESTKAHAHNMMAKALEITGALIAVSIGIGMVAGPIFFATNTTGWDTTSQTIFPILFVLGLVVVLFGFLWAAKSKSVD
jgi:nitrogen fixation-related uncharacterized protein